MDEKKRDALVIATLTEVRDTIIAVQGYAPRREIRHDLWAVTHTIKLFGGKVDFTPRFEDGTPVPPWWEQFEDGILFFGGIIVGCVAGYLLGRMV